MATSSLLPDEEVVDTRMPGGGSMYFVRRVERRGADGRAAKFLLCLGAGGFAATLDGVRVVGQTRTPVALKVISMAPRAAEAFERSEMRGIESLSGRDHASLVRYLGYFKGEDGDGNVVMSFAFERCPTAQPYAVRAEASARGFLTFAPDADLAGPPGSGCDLLRNPLLAPRMRVWEARHVCRQLLSALALPARQQHHPPRRQAGQRARLGPRRGGDGGRGGRARGRAGGCGRCS